MENVIQKRNNTYRDYLLLCIIFINLLGCKSSVDPDLGNIVSGSYLIETWSPLYDLTKPDASLPIYTGTFAPQYALVTRQSADQIRVEAYLVNVTNTTSVAYRFVFPAIAVALINKVGYENQYNLLDPATKKVIGLYWEGNRLNLAAPDSTGHLVSLVVHRGYRTQ